ncbi:MAG: ABC transporter ATP-binding protein [Bacteroidota bacterium]
MKYSLINKIFFGLSKSQKRKAFFVLFSSFLNSLLDVLGLASILPVIAIMLNKELIQKNHIVNFVYTQLHFNSADNFLMFLFILLLCIFIFRAFFFVFIARFHIRFSYDIANDYLKKVAYYYCGQDLLFFKNKSSGELYKNMRVIPIQFARFVVMPFIGIFSELVVLLIIISGIFMYNYKLFFLLLLTIGPFILFFYNTVKKKVGKIGEEIDRVSVILHRDIQEIIEGYVDIKLNNSDDFFVEKLFAKNSYNSSLLSSIAVHQLLPSKIIEVTAVSCLCLIFFFATFIDKGNTELLMLMGIYITASYRILPSFNKLTNSMLLIKEYEYMFDILEKPIIFFKQMVSNSKGEKSISFKKSIFLNNITLNFNQRENPVLDSANIEITKGEICGLIGESGAGKTSIANLILGFFEPTSGNIYIDGVLLTDDKLVDWRKKASYVQQNIFILNGNLIDNIGFGIPKNKISIEKVKKCIEMASLTSLVEQLPEGINTNIGEHGAKLSGGQCQRIAIARALYHDCELLIFDEATSSLDDSTEKEITEVIKQMTIGNNLTVIMIAHRITTLKYCNKIYNIQNGKVEGIYSYNEILAKRNLYTKVS